MKISTLVNLLIGCSLLLTTTTAIAEEKCNGKKITKTLDTKANTDRKNWNYGDSDGFFLFADPSRGEIFKYSPKDNDVLRA